MGQQFGYGVLGHFYGQRDWDHRTFGGESVPPAVVEGGHVAEDNEGAAGSGGPSASEPSSAVVAEEHQVSVGCEALPAGVDDLADEGVLASATATEGSEGFEGSAVLTGSRQTSLSHWLLRDPE